jgi:hypothetical protein
MFHRVGDVGLLAVDAGFLQRTVEHQPRRSHERFAGKIFLVAGLLADQHHLGVLRTFAEHGLRRVFPERTGAAAAGFFAQGFEAAAGRGWRSCHGRFPLPVENIIAAGGAQCGQGTEGSFDPIGIAHEKHKRRSRLTLSAMLALY